MAEARYALALTHLARTLHAYHELSRHRIRPKTTPLLPTPDPTVTGGSSIPQLAVLPLTSGLQDKRERTGNLQAR